MVNGFRYYRALESVSFVYRSYHLPMPDRSRNKVVLHMCMPGFSFIWFSLWICCRFLERWFTVFVLIMLHFAPVKRLTGKKDLQNDL